jgi:hypothetical protein
MPPTPGIRVLNETKTFHLERKRCNFSISKSSGDKKKKRVCNEVKKNVVM